MIPDPTPLPPTPRPPHPCWTIEVRALDGTSAMRASRLPGGPVRLEGDIRFLQQIIAELVFLSPPLTPHPN